MANWQHEYFMRLSQHYVLKGWFPPAISKATSLRGSLAHASALEPETKSASKAFQFSMYTSIKQGSQQVLRGLWEKKAGPRWTPFHGLNLNRCSLFKCLLGRGTGVLGDRPRHGSMEKLLFFQLRWSPWQPVLWPAATQMCHGLYPAVNVCPCPGQPQSWLIHKELPTVHQRESYSTASPLITLLPLRGWNEPRVGQKGSKQIKTAQSYIRLQTA